MTLIGQSVTIVGAGVAGLALARALGLRGAAVTVLEQADQVREVGAGLQISPNGAAVLRALGLQPALEAAATLANAVHLIDGLTGKGVARLDLQRLRPAQGYHFLHRSDLIRILLAGAIETGATLRLLSRLTSVDLSGPQPAVLLEGGERITAPLLIGADGLHSHIRGALNGNARPFFTGQVAWRAVIPWKADADPVAEVHMGPGRHLVSYPLRQGSLRNLVAVEERAKWAEESWTLQGDSMDLRQAFARFSPRVQGWLDRVEDPMLWGLFRHEVAETWVRPIGQGGIAILGDAAHPTLPFLAQGASMGLEDAWVLAAALGSHATVADALADYQARRKPRTTRIVAAANGNARAYHLSGVRRMIGHAGLRLLGRVAPGAMLSRFDWLYGHDVTAG